MAGGRIGGPEGSLGGGGCRSAGGSTRGVPPPFCSYQRACIGRSGLTGLCCTVATMRLSAGGQLGWAPGPCRGALCERLGPCCLPLGGARRYGCAPPGGAAPQRGHLRWLVGVTPPPATRAGGGSGRRVRPEGDLSRQAWHVAARQVVPEEHVWAGWWTWRLPR